MNFCHSSKTKTISLFPVLLLLLATGCSIRRTAVNMVGDALVKGNSVYETDEDIDFVGEALPFGLKFMESLLDVSPEHAGLLLTSCKGFVSYSYAYVQYEADVMEDRDLDRSRYLKRRARKLYLRALSYGLRGLDKNYPGFGNQLFLEPEKAVGRIENKKRNRDLPFLYWSSAALGLAISVSRDDAVLLGRLPEVESLINRGLELDETWENGAFHSFMIQLAAAKVGGLDEDFIRHHFERALELTKGRDAGLYVAFVEAVSVPTQNREEFMTMLNKALEIDPDKNPQTRLMNLIAQRKAHHLLDRVDDLILE
jgi:hypothetical protein